MIKLFYKQQLKKLLATKIKNNQTEINQFIADLKKFNYSIVQTITQICKTLKIGLKDATELVLNSPTWINEKERFIDFNTKVQKDFEQDADDVTENKDGTISLTFNLTKEDKKQRRHNSL